MKNTKISKNLKKLFTPLNLLLIILPIFLIFIIVFFVNFLTNLDKTAEIRILVAPISATVEINGETYPTDTTIKIAPGTYNITITADSFKPYSGTIEAKDHQISYLYEFLTETKEGTNYYDSHPDDAARTQQISDLIAELEQQTYLGTDPIFNITPYSSYSAGFEIYSSRQAPSNFPDSATIQKDRPFVKIYLLTCDDAEINTLRSAALQYLTDHHIDLNNYNITFSNC